MIKMKRAWAAVIVFCMLLALIPMTVFAEGITSGKCGDNLTWAYDETTKTLEISGTGDMYSYSDVNFHDVFMRAPWFENGSIKTNLEKIVVNDGVTSIGKYAFLNCEALKEVRLAESVDTIWMHAFRGCKSLTQINTDAVTTLWNNVFMGCESLESVTLAEGLQFIFGGTFRDCKKLKSLHIPASVTLVEDGFYGCTSLESITVDDKNTMYSSSDGVLYNKDKTLLIKFPLNKSIVGFEIPDTVTNISSGAFYEHQYEDEYENGLLITGKWIVDAKDDIDKNYVINVDDGVTHIANGVFWIDNLKSIIIPKSIVSIGRDVFVGENLESISVDEENTAFSSEDGVLYDKDKITLITYPANKADTEFNAPSSVKVIDRHAFVGNQKLRTVMLPSVEKIGDSAFESMAVTEVTFSSALKKIDNWAFSWCEQLEKADLPDGVEYIGNRSFNQCKTLKNIRIPESVIFVGDYAFNDTYICDTTKGENIYYHDNWLLYVDYDADLPANFEVKEGTVGLCENAFSYHDEITSVTLPSSIKYINDRAFDEDGNLKDIYYVGDLESWGNIQIGDDNKGLKNAVLHYLFPQKPVLSIDGTYTYTGSEQIAEVKGYSSVTMTISGNVQTNAGEYEIVVKPKEKWDDGTADEVKINWTIEKAKPTGTPNVALITTAGKTLADAHLTAEAANLSVSGTVKWVADDGVTELPYDTAVEANKFYTWLFTPTDTVNYEILTGKIKLYTRTSGGGGGISRYNVSFETNGGNKLPNQSIAGGSVVKEPVTPTKEGFDFAGWYTDKELKNKYNFSEKVTKNLVLYAAWTEKDNSANQIILTIGEKTAQVFGQTKTNDVAPKIVNDRTMLPARFVAENLGADVEWDGDKQLVTITGKNLKTGENVTILITIGSETAEVNGGKIELDSPAFVENDRTYTPIRFVSEKLGASVEWLDTEHKAVITK